MKVAELTDVEKQVSQRLQIEKNTTDIFILKRKIEICMDRIIELEMKLETVNEKN